MATGRFVALEGGRGSEAVSMAKDSTRPGDADSPRDAALLRNAALLRDAALLRNAAGGDERAVRALYRAHVDRVVRCVGRILGSSDPDLEDVVQQVFLAALDGAARFDGRSKVSTWIVGIATRRALDAARSRHRRGRWAKMTERVGLGRPAARPDVRHDAVSQAEAVLLELSPDQRTVFVLHEVEGYTFQEIKEMTGTGISTLHARLKAARQRIDATLAEQALAEQAGVDVQPGGGSR